MATAADVRDLLTETSLPAGLVDTLLAGASATWLMGEPADVLASDLALCHPPLAEGEVRAVVKETGEEAKVRLAVAAPDRLGLLAGVADALAAHGLAVTSVRGTAWAEPRLALLSLFVQADPALQEVSWDAVGQELRGTLQGGRARTSHFLPTPPVEVTASPQDAGRWVVTVDAPEQLELLWAAAQWFEEGGANIEAANIDSAQGRFHGTFLVAGPALDPAGLAASLSGMPAKPRPGRMARLVARAGVAAGGLGAAVAWRGLRSSRRK
jgi:glycine cleavage system regulatory protein